MRQRWECSDGGGERHFLTLDEADRPPARRALVLRCPEPGHADGRVQSRGTRTSHAGTWARLRCVRPNGDVHHFQVLQAPSSTALTSLTRPPECVEHPGSAVSRHGSFGTGSTRRQRYRCVPPGGAPHTFTPPLTRQTVAVGTDACTTCDELLSPHRGPVNGARHAPWGLKTIAKALSDLALGSSYAAVGLEMRRSRGVTAAHLREAHGLDVAGEEAPADATKAERARAWRLAANLVEQYSPLLSGPMFARMREREARHRAHNDAALRTDPEAPLERPLTFVCDQLPVWIGRRNERGRYQLTQWALLVVVEVRWGRPRAPGELPERDSRLRLARAYPGSGDESAWRLVLDELGVRPDYLVADCGAGLLKALEQHYPAGSVGFIPSLWHLHLRLREGLLETPAFTTTLQGRRVVAPEFAKHLDLLTREELLNAGPEQWKSWWESLTATARAMGGPTTKLGEQRKVFEGHVAAALPLLARQPQLPASNAGVEARIRHLLEPFLDNRKQMYRNIARTNWLCDLAVLRDQGLLGDLDALAKTIRQDNEAHGGWAPAPRRLDDAQPPRRPDGSRGPLYSSLLSPLVLPALVNKRLGR